MKHWTHLLMKTGMSLEKENMIWNMTGSFFYAFASMVLSFLVLRIAGEEQGGIFSFGFSTVGQQMFLLAYFGIRPFHITDGTNQYRFGDYLHHRYVTCTLALLLGAGYLACIGYSFCRHIRIGFSYLCRLMASLFGNTLAAGPIESSKQTGECKGMTTPCTGNQNGMQTLARTMIRGRDDRSQHDLHEGMHRQSNTAVRTSSNKQGLE